MVDHVLATRREVEGLGLSVGVVSPFRAQVDEIRAELLKAAPDIGTEVAVDTAHGFQGDERDIMVLSPVISAEADDFTRVFAADPNLINVGVTRARSRLIVVGDRDACLASDTVLADLATYYSQLRDAGFDSPVEMRLAEALREIGMEARPGVMAEGYHLDLAVVSDGSQIDVECDGAAFHRDRDADRARDRALETAGWTVVRFSAREVLRDPAHCADQIRELVPQ